MSDQPNQWVHMTHPDIAVPARVPDNPAVREYFEARDWQVVDAPDDEPFVSPVDPGTDDLPRAAAGAVEGAEVDPITGQGWVELVHPLDGDGEGARSRVPADPAVVADMLERGWVLPRKSDGAVPVPAMRAAARRAGHAPRQRDHDEAGLADGDAAATADDAEPTPDGDETTDADPAPEENTSGPADTAADTKEQ